MDDLIARVLAGDATDIEKQHFRRWLEQDPEHERLYRATEAAWKAFDVLADKEAPPPPDVSSILRRARRRSYMPGRRALLAAAALVVVAAASTFAYLRTSGRQAAAPASPSTPSLSLVASSVGSAGINTLTLSDGSVIRLSTGARVDLLAQPGERTVALEGRAFFAVATGAEPFTVSTALGRARVLGTRFEVSTSSEETRVVVVEGTVQLSGDGGATAPAPAGSLGTLRRGAAPHVEAVPDPWALLDWPGGLLLFQSTPLSQVARELQRQFGVPVSVADSAVGSRRVTAWFDQESLDQVLDAVCLVAAVSCRRSPEVVIGG